MTAGRVQEVALRVHQALAPQLAGEERLARLYRDLELPVAEVLFRMERNGVLIDVFALATQSEELGRIFSVTRERVRQIEAKAIRKLRHPSRSQVLRDYLD